MASCVTKKFRVEYPAIGPKPRGHICHRSPQLPPAITISTRQNTSLQEPARYKTERYNPSSGSGEYCDRKVWFWPPRRGIWAQNVERVATSKRKEKHPETIVIRVTDPLLCAHTKHVWTVASNISGIQQFVPSLEDLMAIVYVSLAYILRCMVRTLAVVHPTLLTRSSRVVAHRVPPRGAHYLMPSPVVAVVGGAKN